MTYKDMYRERLVYICQCGIFYVDDQTRKIETLECKVIYRHEIRKYQLTL